MKFKPIRQERLYLKVAEQLSKFIDDGQIAPGDRLPSERDLVEQFGVSRPTIREAMIALELAGRVEIRSGSGVYVKQGEDIETSLLQENAPGPLELLEARFYIESDAAALAAQRASEDDIQSLEQAFQALKGEGLTAELQEEADERFHLLVAKASGNSAMHGTIQQLWQLRRTSKMSIFFHEKLRQRGIKPVIRDHQKILDAIREGNSDTARLAMKNHLQSVIDMIVEEDSTAA